MSSPLSDTYKSNHQHPLNRLCHAVGIPLIISSLFMVFFSWRWAVGTFIAGWFFQFAGHAIEGNQPLFLRNPVYLLVGPWWLLRRALTEFRLIKPSSPRE